MNYQFSENAVQDALAVVGQGMAHDFGVRVIWSDDKRVCADIHKKIVKLPRLACATTLGLQKQGSVEAVQTALNLTRANAAHEFGHCAKTHMTKEEEPEGALFKILNALEDVRMEREVAVDFPGYGEIFKWAGNHANKKIAGDLLDGKKRSPLWQALCGCIFQSQGITPAWTLDDKAKKYFDIAYPDFVGVLNAQDTQECLEIAKRIYDKLKEEKEKEKEKEKEQEKEKQQQKQDQKQEGSEGQEGEGEGEESEGKESDGEESEGNDQKSDKKSGKKSSKNQKDEEASDDEAGDDDKAGDDKAKENEASDDEAGDDKNSDQAANNEDGDEGSDRDEFDDEDQQGGEKGGEKGEGDKDGDEEGDEEGAGKSGDEDGEDEKAGNDKSGKDGEDGNDDKQTGEEKDDGEDDEDGSGQAGDQSTEEDEQQAEAIKGELDEDADGQSLTEQSNDEIEEALKEVAADNHGRVYTSRRDLDEHRVPEGGENQKVKFTEIFDKMQGEVAAMTLALEQALRALTRCRKEAFLRSGRLDNDRLVEIAKGLSKNIFYQKRQGRELHTAVAMVIDQSGSMGSRIADIRDLVILLGECMYRLGIPFEIIGTTTSGNYDDLNGFSRTNPILYDHYKQFEEQWPQVRQRMIEMDARQNNIDGEAVEFAARRVMARPEERKIVFSL